MACFLVPATTAVVTTAMRKRIPERYRPHWLNSMLWGGVTMLAVEHVSHGEVVPYPPFLSALRNPQDTVTMFKEMLTVGVPMTVAIFVLWGVMLLVAERVWERRRLPGTEGRWTG